MKSLTSVLFATFVLAATLVEGSEVRFGEFLNLHRLDSPYALPPAILLQVNNLPFSQKMKASKGLLQVREEHFRRLETLAKSAGEFFDLKTIRDYINFESYHQAVSGVTKLDPRDLQAEFEFYFVECLKNQKPGRPFAPKIDPFFQASTMSDLDKMVAAYVEHELTRFGSVAVNMAEARHIAEAYYEYVFGKTFPNMVQWLARNKANVQNLPKFHQWASSLMRAVMMGVVGNQHIPESDPVFIPHNGRSVGVVEVSQHSYPKGSTIRFGSMMFGFSIPVVYVLTVAAAKASRGIAFAQIGTQGAGDLMMQHFANSLDVSCSTEKSVSDMDANFEGRLDAIHDRLSFMSDVSMLSAVMECCRLKMEFESRMAEAHAFTIIPEFDSKPQQSMLDHFSRHLVYAKYVKEVMPLAVPQLAEPLINLVEHELKLLVMIKGFTPELENVAEAIREQFN